MSLNGKKVAILVFDNFEEAELAEPFKALQAAAADVVVVSPKSGPLRALHHLEKSNTYDVDMPLDEVNFDDFAALVVPGGVVNADHLRMVDKARDWVRYCFETNKPVAVICHGPWLLVSSGVVKGRRLTSYFTLQDDIRNAGGDWVDEEVVVDGKLITSRQPGDLPAFNKVLVEALSDDPAALAAQ